MRLFFSTKLLLALFFACCGAQAVRAQAIQIILGPDEIGENQGWPISVSIQNDRFKSHDYVFPDIPNFKKRGTSSQSQTSVINGQVSSVQSVTMTYLPTKQGTFTVQAFKMIVNGQTIMSPGKKIKVGPPVQSQRDPFAFEKDDFFGRGNPEFIEIKEDAFLALTTSKSEVYVGEGFTTALAFYVADENRAPMSFHDLAKQLTNILKKIKPNTCWEENFNIENVQGESVNINGKYYTQYKLYEATFYPLNTKQINFPSIGLEMIKFKVAKNPSFFGQNRKEDFKTFYSKPKTVKVKELPPHPLRDKVAVGDYRLQESISSTALQTGQSFSYDFNVYGEGNISAIEKPLVLKDGSFEFYEPNIRQDINRQSNRVTGTKSFSYFIIPKEPGEYQLQDFVQFVYFNPATKKYDTLQSKAAVVVSGESLKNEAIESTDGGSFYDKITSVDNTLHTVSDSGWVKIAASIFILVMLAGSAYLVFKKS
jgi:hypothetical protein